MVPKGTLMPFELVVVGTSWGGFQALKTLLTGLPAGFGCAVAIAQHRSSDPAGDLAAMLQRSCCLPVVEPDDKEEIIPGRVYLAPAGYHLLVECGSFALSVEAPVWHARPSIDVLFESAAETYGERVIGIILTGTSQDGARGLAAIKQRGGFAIVQAPDDAERRELPAAALAATRVDRILPLARIAPELASLFHSAVRS